MVNNTPGKLREWEVFLLIKEVFIHLRRCPCRLRSFRGVSFLRFQTNIHGLALWMRSVRCTICRYTPKKTIKSIDLMYDVCTYETRMAFHFVPTIAATSNITSTIWMTAMDNDVMNNDAQTSSLTVHTKQLLLLLLFCVSLPVCTSTRSSAHK